MPVQTSITDCDTNAALNSPQGVETAKGNIDNYLRTAFAFIRQLYNDPLAGLNTPVPIAKGGTSAITAGAARTALGAAANDGSSTFVAAAGTANAITADFTPDVATLTNGLRVCARAAAANTNTAPTFQADATTAKTIVKAHNQALLVGDIPAAGYPMELKYDLTFDKWILLNPFYGESPPLGVGQTWQDMAASRLFSTTYTNSTGRPILVKAAFFSNIADVFQGIVDAAQVDRFDVTASGIVITITLLVPNGSTYLVKTATGTSTLSTWKELR